MSTHLRASLNRDSVIRMNRTEHREAIAAEVRAVAARKGLRQGDLADAIGVSRQAVSRKLAGAAPITVEELLRIAAVLEVSPGDLLPRPIPAAHAA